MEDSLWRGHRAENTTLEAILILVVMEDSLWLLNIGNVDLCGHKS